LGCFAKGAAQTGVVFSRLSEQTRALQIKNYKLMIFK